MPRKKKRAVRAKRERKEGVNTDVLTCIFEYLDKATLLRCARVCRLWRQAAYSPALWKNYMFYVKEDGLSEQTALSLKDRKIITIRLQLNQLVNESTDLKKPHEARSAQDVRHLKTSLFASLQNAAQVADVETVLLQGKPERGPGGYHMNELTTCPRMPTPFTSLKCLFLYNVDILEQGFKAALQALTNIQQLNISWFGSHRLNAYTIETRPLQKVVNFDFLAIILSHLPTLKDLELSQISATVWSGFSSRVTLNICDDATLPDLERLALKSVGQISTGTIGEISSKFPGLKHLELTINECSRINEGTIRELAIPPFRELISFRGNNQFGMDIATSANIISLLTLMPNLKALEFDVHQTDQLKHESMLRLMDTTPKLAVLKLAGYRQILQETVHSIVHTFKQLEVLYLQASMIRLDRPEEVSKVMARKLTKLESFLSNVELPNIDELPSLKYKWFSESEMIRQRVCIPDSPDCLWLEVKVGSDLWKKALGYQYFHPGGAFCIDSHLRPGLDIKVDYDASRENPYW